MGDRAIIDAVIARISSPHFPGDVQERPEVIDLDDDLFVASHVMYCRTISGSDWVEHFLFVGRRRPLAILAEHHRSVSERVYEHYRPRVAIDEVVAHARTGATAPFPSAEVARANQIADEAAAAHRTPSIEARTVARCPRCGSTAAGLHEAIFEISDMRCETCGHRELVDLYGQGDDWHVTLTLPVGAPLPAVIAPPSPSPSPPTPPAPSPAPPAPPAPPPRPLPDLPFDPGPIVDELSPDLRCPQCHSADVRDDPGSALLHFTFLRCGRCQFGEEISSLSAVSRWRTLTS